MILYVLRSARWHTLMTSLSVGILFDTVCENVLATLYIALVIVEPISEMSVDPILLYNEFRQIAR